MHPPNKYSFMTHLFSLNEKQFQMWPESCYSEIYTELYLKYVHFISLTAEILTKHQWYTGSEIGKALYEAIGNKERTVIAQATWVPHSITTDQTQ